MLISLKKHLALTDRAKEYEITKRYVKLMSVHPGRVARHVNQNVVCNCVKWVKVIVFSSCVRAEDILCGMR